MFVSINLILFEIIFEKVLFITFRITIGRERERESWKNQIVQKITL